MVSSLLTPKPCGVLFGVFFLTAGSLASDSSKGISSAWELDLDSENNLNESTILWEKNNSSLIKCTLLCGRDPSCRSFFHHPSLEKCLGSQSYKRGLPASQAMKQGWKYYTQHRHCDGDYVYNQTLGLCYKLHEGFKNYTDATALCETEGAKLPIIRNEAELRHLSNIVQERGGFWIGLQGTDANTLWKWWNGQTASYFAWYPGYPSSVGCVYIWEGQYCTVECNYNMTYVVCQRYI